MIIKTGCRSLLLVFVLLVLLGLTVTYSNIYLERNSISLFKVYVGEREAYLLATPRSMNNEQFCHLHNTVTRILISAEIQNPIFLFIESNYTIRENSQVEYSCLQETLSGFLKMQIKSKIDLISYKSSQPFNYMVLNLSKSINKKEINIYEAYKNNIDLKNEKLIDVEHIYETIQLLMDGTSLYFAIVESDYLYGNNGLIAVLKEKGFSVKKVDDINTDYSFKFLYKPKLLTQSNN